MDFAKRSDEEEERYRFIPLFPGVSSFDWREAEAAMLNY